MWVRKRDSFYKICDFKSRFHFLSLASSGAGFTNFSKLIRLIWRSSADLNSTLFGFSPNTSREKKSLTFLLWLPQLLRTDQQMTKPKNKNQSEEQRLPIFVCGGETGAVVWRGKVGEKQLDRWKKVGEVLMMWDWSSVISWALSPSPLNPL